MPIYAIILIILGTLFLFFIIYLLFMKHIFNKTFKRGKEVPLTEVDLSNTHYAPYTDLIKKNMDFVSKLKYEELYIKSYDNLKLYGRYYNKNSNKTVIFVHGYKATPYNNFATQIISFLNHNYNALVIFNRAHGKSEGKYITMAYNESKDLHVWIDEISNRYEPKSIVLYGTSMGGASVIISEGEKNHEKVKVVIDDCGFKNVKTVIQPKLKKNHIPLSLVMPILNIYCKIFSNFDLKSRTPEKYISNITKPMVFIHSYLDDVVEIKDSEYLLTKCKNEKLLLFENNAGHTSTFMANQTKIENELYEFLDKFM